MDSTVGAALIAVAGTLAGVFGTRWVEATKARTAQVSKGQETYREQLRMACSAHSGNLTTYLQAALEEGRAHRDTNLPSVNYVPSANLVALRHAARVSTEQLRLLSNSSQVQKKARLALRHAYAVMLVAGGHPDPRAGDYPQGPAPYNRFEIAFHEFLVESRRELGFADPEDVFAEP